ncbi:MAG TPA: PadR family transcriptional regulator, partial [Microbacteriaceae bacterium]|nr:PadR family transcriptional regulator [Microbacteriaceae bacterium]
MITPLAIATLALLAERPMHPYEMYQTLIQRAEDRIVKVR